MDYSGRRTLFLPTRNFRPGRKDEHESQNRLKSIVAGHPTSQPQYRVVRLPPYVSGRTPHDGAVMLAYTTGSTRYLQSSSETRRANEQQPRRTLPLARQRAGVPPVPATTDRSRAGQRAGARAEVSESRRRHSGRGYVGQWSSRRRTPRRHSRLRRSPCVVGSPAFRPRRHRASRCRSLDCSCVPRVRAQPSILRR